MNSLFLKPCRVVIVFLLLLCSQQASAAEIEPKEIAAGFEKPVWLAPMPGEKARLCVLEEAGRLVCLKNGFRPGKKPFLDFSEAKRAVASVDDAPKRVAIAVAFHPKYKENGLLYVSSSYTGEKPGVRLVVSEFKRSLDGDRASAASERELWSFQVPHRDYAAGAIAVDAQGAIFIGVPDGGGNFDPKETAQNPRSFLGSILRIDPLQGDPYLSPIDNPFVGDEKKGLPEVYAYGFHNPVSISVDQKSGEVWSVDRGVSNFEEINLISSGRNYGWSVFEGSLCQRMKFQCLDTNYFKPVLSYSHNEGSLILGGYVYRGANLPELDAEVIFADGAAGAAWRLLRSAGAKAKKERLLSLPPRASVIGLDSDGEIYAASYGDGKLFLLTPASN